MVGDSSLSQSKSVSSDSLSTFKDFISEFKLEDENSGTNTNNKEDVDESLILYNLIYTLYEKIQNSRLQQRNKRKLRKNACDTLSNML